jgi:phage shock protein C
MATKRAEEPLNNKRMVRPLKGRRLAGVCLGIANYFNIDPTVIRLFWVLMLLPGGIPGILLYILAWMVIPEE